MGEMDAVWTEVLIRGALIDPVTGEPTILLEDVDERALITVPGDPSTAGALIQEVEGLGHDPAQTLLYRFFVRHGIVVDRLELSRDRSGSIGGLLRYRLDGTSFGMEVRPIDGLVITAQAHAPVLVDASLLDGMPPAALPGITEGRDLLILSRRALD